MSRVESVACAACGERLPPPKRKGRPRRYCDSRCRKRAYRDRQQLADGGWVAHAAELDELVPADPLTVQRQSFQAVADLLDGEPAGAAEDQLARALIEQRALLWRFRRLESELPPQLGGRTGEFAEHLLDGLRRWFGGLIE